MAALETAKAAGARTVLPLVPEPNGVGARLERPHCPTPERIAADNVWTWDVREVKPPKTLERSDRIDTHAQLSGTL